MIRHWHDHAIAPRPDYKGVAGRTARNIATRAKELTFAIVSLGERLAALAAALNYSGLTGKDFVQLDRDHLDYHGWWTDQFVEPVTRHAPSGMARDEFLSRCLDLDKLATPETVLDDWWPDMLRHIPSEKPWDDESVTVAEIKSFADPYYPGVRILWSALVSTQQLAVLNGELRRISHEVESSGRPGPGRAGELNPKFYISAEIEGQRLEFEPLILGWRSNDHTAMALDPRFAMTYGLMPRAVGDGTIRWDDLALPEFDVAILDPPSRHTDGWQSESRASVMRTYLQDYLSLRGLHLVQVYFEQRRADQDLAIEAFLGTTRRREAEFDDRLIDVMTGDNGGFIAQVWGARYVAGPGSMPITDDDLDHVGLQWPGLPDPVTHTIARRQRPSDYVYVKDEVLAAYEGQAGFQIYPPSGGVSYGSQWSIG